MNSIILMILYCYKLMKMTKTPKYCIYLEVKVHVVIRTPKYCQYRDDKVLVVSQIAIQTPI